MCAYVIALVVSVSKYSSIYALYRISDQGSIDPSLLQPSLFLLLFLLLPSPRISLITFTSRPILSLLALLPLVAEPALFVLLPRYLASSCVCPFSTRVQACSCDSNRFGRWTCDVFYVVFLSNLVLFQTYVCESLVPALIHTLIHNDYIYIYMNI